LSINTLIIFMYALAKIGYFGYCGEIIKLV